MHVTIEIPEDRASHFQKQAHSRGLSIDQWLLQLAEQSAPASIADLQRTNPLEWARQFHEWAESHDRTTPLLSEQAISRDSIYQDRF